MQDHELEIQAWITFLTLDQCIYPEKRDLTPVHSIDEKPRSALWNLILLGQNRAAQSR